MPNQKVIAKLLSSFFDADDNWRRCQAISRQIPTLTFVEEASPRKQFVSGNLWFEILNAVACQEMVSGSGYRAISSIGHQLGFAKYRYPLYGHISESSQAEVVPISSFFLFPSLSQMGKPVTLSPLHSRLDVHLSLITADHTSHYC